MKLNKKIIENIILAYESPYLLANPQRIIGCLEGILLSYGKLDPGVPFNYKTITYEYRWLFRTKTKTRRQTYPELIIEKAKELISEME